MGDSIVNGRIERGNVDGIRPFGTFVRVGGKVHLVHAFDQSWCWPYSPHLHFRVGDPCSVWIGTVARNGKHVEIASFRLVHPEGRFEGMLLRGDKVAGKVRVVAGGWVSVTFGVCRDADFPEEAMLGMSGKVSKALVPGNTFIAVVDDFRHEGVAVLRPEQLVAD